MSSKKEWATQALVTRDFGPMDIEYVEALAFDKLPQYYADSFDFFKMYSNELPSKEVVGEWHPSYPMMKCRGNVIVGIGVSLASAVTDGVLSDQDETEVVDHYRNYNWTFQQGSKGEVWTTQYEIELINKTLEFVSNKIKTKFDIQDKTHELKSKFAKELLERRKSYLLG